eukprot:jgi/Bigna1/89697/estExt_fgenesh1_pg.C_540007
MTKIIVAPSYSDRLCPATARAFPETSKKLGHFPPLFRWPKEGSKFVGVVGSRYYGYFALRQVNLSCRIRRITSHFLPNQLTEHHGWRSKKIFSHNRHPHRHEGAMNTVAMIASIMALNFLHGGFVYLTATQLLGAPPTFPTTAEAVMYVLRQILGPILVTLWLSFEFKAVSRLWLDDRFVENKTAPTHWSRVLDRYQHQTFEQSVVTLLMCVLITIVVGDFGDSSIDVRLPIAWAITFVMMRPVYMAGYLFDPLGTSRALGLFAGGFWSNFPAALYCSIHCAFGVVSVKFAFNLYVGFIVGMSIVIGILNNTVGAKQKQK